MKKNVQKGFTLIELIIVMAIFGIIMLGALQFLDPVNKEVKNASVQEANTAAVDNMKRYMEGSLRYATAVEVHMGDLKQNNEDATISKISGLSQQDREMAAAKNFVKRVYTDRVKENSNDPYQGKVYVMCIDNDNGGMVYESEYNFTAGYTYKEWVDSDDDWTKIVTTDPTLSAGSYNHKPVINEAYFKDSKGHDAYRYFITAGYHTMAATHEDTGLPAPKKNTFYGKLKNMDDGSGKYTFNQEMFTFSFVTYKADANTDIANGIFQSPYAESNATMALMNINSAFINRDFWYPVRLKGGKTGSHQYLPNEKVDRLKAEGGSSLKEGSDSKWDYEQKATPADYFSIIDENNSMGGNNIYIIYTLPTINK